MLHIVTGYILLFLTGVILVSTSLSVPKTTHASKPITAVKPSIPTPSPNPYTSPVDLEKVYVSTEFTDYHPGIDLAPVENQDNPLLHAIAKGTVIYADATSYNWFIDDYGGYGNTVVIDHHNGLYSLYAHLEEIKVEKGEKVEKGKEIGTLGTTGNSTGPHLHIEVCTNECKGWLAKKEDPGKFFDVSNLPRGS